MKISFKEAQKFVAENMVAIIDDDYPDQLDHLAVILMDEYDATDKEADDVVCSEWYRI
tara:strand:+ start:536 stop:709 length:174 start_codon:yes stop_codon:yes gene_type:complete